MEREWNIKYVKLSFTILLSRRIAEEFLSITLDLCEDRFQGILQNSTPLENVMIIIQRFIQLITL